MKVNGKYRFRVHLEVSWINKVVGPFLVAVQFQYFIINRDLVLVPNGRKE